MKKWASDKLIFKNKRLRVQTMFAVTNSEQQDWLKLFNCEQKRDNVVTFDGQKK